MPCEILSALLAISALLHGSQVAALGLGELRTQSALNQPFYGEIELFDVDNNALDSVKASLASRSAFEQAGIEQSYSLARLQFTPMIGPRGEPMIQVITREPIREPYLDLLVEVVWPDGRLVKEYAVLLDPPAVGGQHAARAVPPPARARTVQSPLAAAAERSSRPQPESVASSNAEVSESTIRSPSEGPESAEPVSREARAVAGAESLASGIEIPASAAELDFPLRFGPVPSDTGLFRIALDLKPPGATFEQTAMALYRNSQDAFISGDINRLRLGAELVIPTAAELFALGPDLAREQYRAALAGRPVVKAPLTDLSAPSTISTPEAREIAVAVAEGAEKAPPDLEAPSAASDSAPSAAGERFPQKDRSQADVAVEPELLLVSEANRQEAIELRARAEELEAQLDDTRRLLDLRNAQLASLAINGTALGVLDVGSSFADGSKTPTADDSASATDATAGAAARPDAAGRVTNDEETPRVELAAEATTGAESAAQAGAETQGKAGAETAYKAGERAEGQIREDVAEEPAGVAATSKTRTQATTVDAGLENSADAAINSADAGLAPIEEVDSVGAISAWRQAMPAWALPLVVVALLLALLGLIVRRRQQAPSAAPVDAVEVPSGDGLVETAPLVGDLNLDPEWPAAEVMTAPTARAAAKATDGTLTAEVDRDEPSLQVKPTVQGVAIGDPGVSADSATGQEGMSPEHGVGSGLGIAPELEVQPASRAQEWSISAADGRLTSDQHGAEHALAARDPGELMMDQVTGSGPDDRTELVDAEGQGQRSEPSAIAAAAGSNGSEPGQDASRLVDVLAEADVYLTYGRYRDAERVLRETMSAVGETSGLRYKLADTYLAAGDLDALAPLAEKMRVEADSDLDGARWRRIEDALATQAPESALPERETGIDPVDNDEEPLFLDLDELEQVTESRSTQAPPLPSELDQHSAEMGAADRDLDRLQLDLAALNAMTNDPLDHGLPPEGMAQPTASDDLSESMGDAVNPELPTLAGLAEGLAEGPEESAPSPTFEKQPEAQAESDDQRQLLQGQAQTQTQTELDGVADSAETPGGDEDSLDRGPGLGSTDEARDERWPIETGEAWDEVALKLDLARAYLDMEDADAASAILKEVVAEGHDEQRREAEALLAGLN